MQLITLSDILHFGEKIFTEADLYFGHGTDNAWDEAVALVRYVLHLEPDVGKEVLERILTSSERDEILKLFDKRINERIPAAYLTHEAWFAGLSFYVDERVLIPRSPVAELIENEFSPWVNKSQVKRILDIGTGSGCIAIACALAFPDAKVDAVDISDDAIAVANINIEKHQVQDRVRLIKSNVFSGICEESYDIIISNPPYVPEFEYQDLPDEYRREPKLALAAGEYGLDIVETILKEAKKHLTKDGILIVEVGNTEQIVAEAFPDVPFVWLDFERGGGGVFVVRKSEV